MKEESHDERIERISRHLSRTGQLDRLQGFAHHGHTSVYDHVHTVSRIALRLNEKWGWNVDPDRLVRASLLHDYFLYDWHDKSHPHPRPHGFTHPKVAARNAHRDYGLDEWEIEAIHSHMFPLTPMPPKHREGWLLTMADKMATWQELKQYWRKKLKRSPTA